jgi:hypothetical protein
VPTFVVGGWILPEPCPLEATQRWLSEVWILPRPWLLERLEPQPWPMEYVSCHTTLPTVMAVVGYFHTSLVITG